MHSLENHRKSMKGMHKPIMAPLRKVIGLDQVKTMVLNVCEDIIEKLLNIPYSNLDEEGDEGPIMKLELLDSPKPDKIVNV